MKNSLRRKLLDNADNVVSGMVEAAEEALSEIGQRNGVSEVDLAKLIANKRTDSVRNAMVRQIADAEEQALIDKFNRQVEADYDEAPEDSS